MPDGDLGEEPDSAVRGRELIHGAARHCASVQPLAKAISRSRAASMSAA
jgi:hypothetical protein